MALVRRQATAPITRRIATATPPAGFDQLGNRVIRRVRNTRENPRQIFGASLNLERIAGALQQADLGAPRALCDLSRETIDTDPHLAAVLQKRIGALASLPLEVIPADGPGVDPDKATYYADVVRAQVERIPNLKLAFRQLAWGLFDGRSALEKLWTLVPGSVHPRYGQVKWVVTGLEWIHPRLLNIGPNRELRYVERQGVTGFTDEGIALRDLPRHFIWFTPQLFGDYIEREGLARRCLYWSFFKRFGARERMILLELFAKPWRTAVIDKDADIGENDIDAIEEILEQLPGNGYGAFPRGVSLNVTQPQRMAGDIHQETIEEADKQNSKLVLGQTGTTDAQAMGLGSTQSVVMQSEQLMITLADADMLSEVIEDYLGDQIIEANYGAAEVAHAPRLVLKADLKNREKELDRLKKTVEGGMPVSLKDAYEVSGFRQPADNEAVIRMVTRASGGEFPATPEATIVYPKGQAEQPGDLAAQPGEATTENDGAGGKTDAPPAAFELAPTDLAKVVSVNEARQTKGLGPLLGADGKTDPDGALTIAEFEAKRLAKGEVQGKEAAGVEPAEDPPSPPPPSSNDGPPKASPAPPPPKGPKPLPPPAPKAPGTPAVGSSEESDEQQSGAASDDAADATGLRAAGGVSRAVLLARGAVTDQGAERIFAAFGERAPVVLAAMGERALMLTPHELYGEHVCAAKQPSSVYGSIEAIIAKAVPELALRTSEWAKKLISAGSGLDSPIQIYGAVSRAARGLDLDEYVRSLSRRVLHGEMLGALDSSYEAAHDVEIAPAKFAAPADKAAVPAKPGFADKSFKSAQSFFESKDVLTKEKFDALAAGAKRRAFTVARLQSQDLLNLVHAELGRMIGEGADVKQFSKFMNERIVSAGWTPASSSHIETIARTNIAQAHSVGRLTEMTQPAALVDRPYWQIRGVKDSRQRPTHGAVDGWVLKASDPFWQHAVTPWGYNCRDRMSSLSEKQVKARGLTVHDGSEIQDLPDPGFSGSGMRSLLGDFGV
ncbi:MAG TPA: DUF935 family protein [Polyangiaceae bacterium]|jgi:SPP1 gp7 family putative phage head morphogenesis protein|nr:DUF935 family protein [Polyangiaceae bacterium]